MLPKLNLREAMRSISQIKALSLLAPNARPYYEGDVQDMSRSTINNTNIQASVDVKAAEFDLDFSGKVDQVELPDIYGLWY